MNQSTIHSLRATRPGAFRAVATVALLGTFWMTGCSDDDDNVVNPPVDEPGNTDTTTWDADGEFWRTRLDASVLESFVGFSFVDRDVASGLLADAGSEWDISFRREEIKLNGGASGTGSFEGAMMTGREFASITTSDIEAATWESDATVYSVDEWFSYNPVSHQLELTQNVYSILDATGSHYAKFRIDQLEGSSQTSMGTVHLTYFSQSTVGDRMLDGDLVTTTVEVGDGLVYFDFSSGMTVTPADPATSLDWDIALSPFNVALNSGPSGSGDCAAFPAFGELGEMPTAIEMFTEQPAQAPLFPDMAGSVLTDWYDYNPQVHQLSAKDQCYILRSGDRAYKMKIEGYYADVNGQPVSANYNFIWAEL